MKAEEEITALRSHSGKGISNFRASHAICDRAKHYLWFCKSEGCATFLTPPFVCTLWFEPQCLLEVLWCPPKEGEPSEAAGVGGGRGVGVHPPGLHTASLPRAHLSAPAGRGHWALCQQNAGWVPRESCCDPAVCSFLLLLGVRQFSLRVWGKGGGKGGSDRSVQTWIWREKP